ncbi:uncharacterized protein LOC132278289 [Cornus florida]|uniref:uncharacterized protein LOC132278289 n=1 Tax=Cornus florida TaxID=4283 RepID=UPI00289F46F9|nr:uncharacterized protein LOC132278289 [Cornus florida]
MSITSDAITGVDQSKKKLWERILEQYKQHIGVLTERNDGGLMNRWSVIQQKINKFSGYITTIEMNRPSDFSSDDMMIAAKDLFHSQTGGEFKLETTTDGASTEESPPIGENDSSGVEEYQLQRPAGRKAAKQRRTKINSANELRTSFVSKFNNITTCFKSRQEKMKNAQMTREVRKMKKEKEFLEKQRLEEKEFMLTDPNSAPTEAGKAWIIARQNEILASLNSWSAPKFP